MADPLAEIRRMVKTVEDLEAEYLAGLTELDRIGGTDDQIAFVAIERKIRMLSQFIGLGMPGASPMELARAAVEALKHCGRLRAEPRAGAAGGSEATPEGGS